MNLSLDFCGAFRYNKREKVGVSHRNLKEEKS